MLMARETRSLHQTVESNATRSAAAISHTKQIFCSLSKGAEAPATNCYGLTTNRHTALLLAITLGVK